MRILVTGAGGFIGSVVVLKLLEQGHEVRCYLRDPARAQRLEGLDYETVLGDILDPVATGQALEGCEAVIHLACISDWSNIRSGQMQQVVVQGTRNVLESARRAGCRRAVYVSSSLAVCASESPRVFDESSPASPHLSSLVYARAKIEAEGLCRALCRDGLEVVIVNPCEVYGPRDDRLVTAGNLIDFARSSPVLVCDGGTSVVFVEDVAEGILAALQRGTTGERYILGGENLTVRQLAELTLELLGRQQRIVKMPNKLLRPIAWLGRTLRLPLPFEPEVIPYATLYWFMDNSKACRELNLSFRSARDTLAPTLRWLQETGHIA